MQDSSGVRVKRFASHDEQLAILVRRGMRIDDAGAARSLLERASYFRLSGYWYPFRRLTPTGRADDFVDGARFGDVAALYAFDERLRTSVLDAIGPVETTVRSVLGHALGRIHPCAHLDPGLLGPLARNGGDHASWRAKYEAEVSRSREEFVVHHRNRYDGTLPVWAAVQVLDWGGLVRLAGFAPRQAQDEIAEVFGLRAPQVLSWLRSLNILRNTAAHHGRMFNRVWTKQPRLPTPGLHPVLDHAADSMNRTFGQLTLLQYLREQAGIGRSGMLRAVLASYPDVPMVSLTHTGTPPDWRSSPLWR